MLSKHGLSARTEAHALIIALEAETAHLQKMTHIRGLLFVPPTGPRLPP